MNISIPMLRVKYFTKLVYVCMKSVIGEELPLLELGFSSTSEFLQRVPGIQVVRPPGEHSVMVFSTYSQVEEKKEKMAKDEVIEVVTMMCS